MRKIKKRSQWWSIVGVVIMAAIMPGLLQLANRAVRIFVGAEGRLAAISVETGRPLGPMPRVWGGLAQGGEDLTGFLTKSGEKIAILKPEYIRIDHVYDGFGVVKRDNGKLVYDWDSLDKLVGDIVRLGAKPFLALSYMPPEISSGDMLSEPKDWNEWSRLVRATIEHYSGSLEIDGVYYEIWNEPDLFGNWRMGGKKDYKNLYYYASIGAVGARGVKDFKLGGPATTGLYRSWMDNFFPFILNNRLRLDFFSWHRYDLDPKKFADDAASVDKWIESQPYFSKVEEIITEMGPQSQAGGVNDSQMGAAHLVSVARELMGRVRYGFSFAVTGNWGIVGKPRYTALEFLSRLGTDRLSVTGEGTWVRAIAAKSGDKYQVILVNYDINKTHIEVVPVTFLGIKNAKFTLRKQMLGQDRTEETVATTEAALQTMVLMPANSVAFVELESKD